MVAYTADYYAMAPVWGVLEFDAEDEAQFLYQAELDVRDLHDGATNIDIRNIKLVD